MQVVPYTGEIGAGAPERDVSVGSDQIMRCAVDTERRQRRSFLVYQRRVTGAGFIRRPT